MSELPDKWWRDPVLLQEEVAKYDSRAACARTHGISPKTLASAWADHGLPALPAGPKAKRKAPQAPPPPEVGEEVSELEVLRARVKAQDKILKKVREGEIAEERIISRLEAAIPLSEPAYTPRVIKRTYTSEPQEMVVLFSDTHASEVVSLEETEGMNAYDWDIMLERMNVMQQSVFSHQDHQAFPVEVLNVWMLGDMLSGDIHDELAITNDRPTADAVVDLSGEIAAWLEAFTERFPKVKVRGVPGNHPRMTKKPANKMAHNNADWLMYKMLELRLAGHEAFDFQFKRGAYQVVTVADRWRTLLMHGDGIRTTMPGVPWGGVVRRVTTLEQQFAKAKQGLDYVALGHFHTANSLDGVQARTFLNGSVKGLDEFSLKQFGSGRDASQLLLTFHPKRGWTGTLPLDLQEVMPAGEGW